MSITARAALKWVVNGILLLLILFIAINVRDEALSPEAQAFGAVSEPAVADRDNAFFAILGFTVPLDQNPHEQGMQAAARYEAAVAQRSYSVDNSVFDAPTNIGDLICGGKNDGCRQQRRQQTDLLTATLNTHKGMLARYEQLYAYPHYRDTLTPTLAAPSAPFKALTSAHQLLLARVVLSARGGDLDQALTTLERDMRFWRMMLSDADSLIAKIIAARQMTNNVNLLSELISQNKCNAGALQEKAQAIVLPLTEQERDLDPALRREFRVAQHMFTAFSKDRDYRRSMMYSSNVEALSSISGDVLFRLFYQPNATVNSAYRDHVGQVAVMALPAREFIKQLPVHGAEAEPNASLIRWDFIYNPLGKYMLALESPDFRKYKAQLYNLDGLLRLVAIQIKAKQDGVAPSQMTDLLRNAGDTFANPYTGAPMQYDANEHRLYFLGVDNNLLPAKRIEVLL